VAALSLYTGDTALQLVRLVIDPFLLVGKLLPVHAHGDRLGGEAMKVFHAMQIPGDIIYRVDVLIAGYAHNGRGRSH
jgi:hypothetical protein